MEYENQFLINDDGSISTVKLVIVLKRLAEKCNDLDLLDLLEEVDLDELDRTEAKL